MRFDGALSTVERAVGHLEFIATLRIFAVEWPRTLMFTIENESLGGKGSLAVLLKADVAPQQCEPSRN